MPPKPASRTQKIQPKAQKAKAPASKQPVKATGAEKKKQVAGKKVTAGKKTGAQAAAGNSLKISIQ